MIYVEGDFVRTCCTGEGEFGIKRGNIGVLVDSREEPLLNSIFRRALRLILRSFHGLYLYTNPRKRLALIARRA